jgi:DNA-binding NarL/FixJ family response regulator
MIRVLIVAAYASVRAGLHSLLAGADDMEIVAEASGSAEGERLLPESRPDVVLADDLPEDRARLLALLAEGDAALVLLGEARDGFRALAGAPLPGWAFLLKDAGGAEIAGAVRAASAGLIALDRSLVPWADAARAERNSTVDRPGDTLTAREREVLALLARGLPNKQIAARLAISLHTVKFHVASVLAKLGASSRTEAVTLGARRGAVSL